MSALGRTALAVARSFGETRRAILPRSQTPAPSFLPPGLPATLRVVSISGNGRLSRCVPSGTASLPAFLAFSVGQSECAPSKIHPAGCPPPQRGPAGEYGCSPEVLTLHPSKLFPAQRSQW